MALQELVSSPDRYAVPQSVAPEVANADPVGSYNYGLALMDGQFWEEAIDELSMAAGLGHERLKCWELCGDCASKLGKWEDAFRFYEYVYADVSITGEQKKSVLTKIARCSQTRLKEDARATSAASRPANAAPEERQAKSELDNSAVPSLHPYSIDSVIGRAVTSWADPTGKTIAGRVHWYGVTDLLHIGSSSVIVELEEQGSGEKYAGQALSGKFGNALSAEKLALWVRRQMAISSRHLVRVHDLADINGYFLLVREYLPLSLSDLLAAGGSMPISLAVRLGYQILEALGDLHLHITPEGRSGNLFHLDLRPSRVLLRSDTPWVKLYNGGLWKEIEKASPARTDLRELPLAHLCYRAPEQFRPYLSRKRPPVFTDIYLFGALLYEMLTGTPAFKASSLGEYEIQHCEQYPTPPRVWRPEIPEVLNDLIMKCLVEDPMKRFRSATQISLAIEKTYPNEVARPKDDSYPKYLQSLKLV